MPLSPSYIRKGSFAVDVLGVVDQTQAKFGKVLLGGSSREGL